MIIATIGYKAATYPRGGLVKLFAAALSYFSAPGVCK